VGDPCSGDQSSCRAECRHCTGSGAGYLLTAIGLVLPKDTFLQHEAGIHATGALTCLRPVLGRTPVHLETQMTLEVPSRTANR